MSFRERVHRLTVYTLFEDTSSRDPQLDYLLRTECLLRPGSTWLLRIASDGLAYECRSLRVRQGESYILLSTVGPVEANSRTTPIDLECEGVHAVILDLPQSLSTDWQESIQSLGLGQARTIEVWPAGLTALEWDGDGYGEWLASERPCLAILPDHPLTTLRVSMDTSPHHAFELTSVGPGEPVFLELPQLPVGVHRLRFSAHSSLAGQPELLDDQEAEIRIREDRALSSIVDPRGPLSVQVDPEAPTMEQLWQGEVDILLRGPKDRKVSCHVSLFERDGDVAILSKQLPPVNLPAGPEDWKNNFDKYFRQQKDVQDAYDKSNVCTLAFAAYELGSFAFRFERPFTPIRWALRRQETGYRLRLYDDRGYQDPPVVSRVAFESPCVEETLPIESDVRVPSSGGLYVARTTGHCAAIIVPPVLHGYGLAELGITPKIEHWDRSPDSAISAVAFASLWGQARLTGDLLSAIRRQKVMHVLVYELFRLLCGVNWARAEEHFTSSGGDTKGLEVLSRAISRNPTEAAVGTVLLLDAETMARETCDHRIDYLTSAAVKYRLLPESTRRMTTAQPESTGVVTPKGLVELALRLASDPASAEGWAGPELRTGLNRLMDSPSLARAARFVVMATELYSTPGAVFEYLYAGWKWA